MPSLKNKDDQTIMWVIIAAIIVIVIGVIIYFLVRNKKENYIQDDEENIIENYEDEEAFHHYLIESYFSDYVEEYELLHNKIDNSHPLNEHFHKILHISNVISRAPNLNIVREEAKRIGLHPEIIKKHLEDEKSAHKFSTALNLHLANNRSSEHIGQILKVVAPEVVEDVKDRHQIEKFQTEYLEEKKGLKVLQHKLDLTKRFVHRFKKCLEKHLHHGHKVSALPHNPEVKHAARKAHVDKETLHKITSCFEETVKFIKGEKTLEDYTPEEYIENFWFGGDVVHAVAGAVDHVVSKVSEVAHTVAHGVIDAADSVAEAAKKAGKAIADTAQDVAKGVAEAAEKVGKVVVQAAETVAKGATAAFNAVKNAVTNGINSLVEGIDEFVTLLKDFGEILRKLIVQAIHKLLDFLQEYFPALLGQYIRCKDGTPNKLTPCASGVYEINDKKLKEFCAKKVLQLVFALIGQPEFALLLKVPGIKDLLVTGVVKIFNKFWPKYVDPLLSDLLNKVIHAADPSIKDVKVSVTEWYKHILENFKADTKRHEFKKKLKEHLRKCIKNCHKYEKDDKEEKSDCIKECRSEYRDDMKEYREQHRHTQIPTYRPTVLPTSAPVDEAENYQESTLHPHLLGRDGHGVRKEHPHHVILNEKKNRIHELLSHVVSEEHKVHLHEIVDRIMEVTH